MPLVIWRMSRRFHSSTHRLSRILSPAPHQLLSDTSYGDLLPLELWQLVFAVLTDEDLLTAARVCCVWNDCCIPIFLLSKNVALASGDVCMGSELLPVLRLSRVSPQIHTLTCRPLGSLTVRDLKCVQYFVSRSQHIEALTLSFCCNFVDIHHVHNLTFSSVRDGLFGVMYAMAQKTQGLVVVVVNSEIHVLEPRDLAQWLPSNRPDYLDTLRRLPLVKKVQAVLAPGTRAVHVRLPVGRLGKVPVFACLSELHAAEIRTVHPTSRPHPPFTLITLNKAKQGALLLGELSSAGTRVSAEHLNVCLPYIRLPVLERIEIAVTLDRSALTSFLEHHPGILSITLGRAQRPVFATGESLTSAPIAPPHLCRLVCKLQADDLVPLLNSFYPPPPLGIVVLNFPQADAFVFRRAMRRLSLQPTLLRLDLCFTATPGNGWPDAEDRLIGSVLYCVDWLYIECSTAEAVRAVLPWVASLPRLQSVHFFCRPGDSVRLLLMADVRAALPWVPDTMVS
ncbi:hypothetical protein DFH06DRAFT_754362 [Mycena polygramma]|nr:hypothetical protein DFH06DRAFT_754362 [Mycena polygramma]